MLFECVILLHGLARTDLSMITLERSLKNDNYEVVNYQYPSREYEVEELANHVSSAIESCSGESKAIHFVTHSLGGILLRQYLSDQGIPKLDKVVMLAPPNKGSEVVDKLGKYGFFKLFNGPAGLQLGTSDQSIPNSIGAWPEDSGSLGIIAGEKSINLFLSYLIPDKDDGKVSIDSTKLEGMADHKVMKTTHAMMMHNGRVINEIKTFLKSGSFSE